MAQNLVINGVTYNGVTSLEMRNTNGETVPFYPAFGVPVFGEVDANNNLILTGELADGTYSVQYKDTDGTITVISMWKKGAAYTNVLATATGNSGEVLKGVGYQNGFKLSSYSGQVTSDQVDTGYFATGFIEYSALQAKNRVPFYVKGVTIDLTSLPAYLRVGLTIPGSTEWFGVCTVTDMSNINQVTIDQLGDKYYKITPNSNFSTLNGWWGKGTTHVRFSFPGSGSGVIITIDEPIE